MKAAFLSLLLLAGCAHWRGGEWTFSNYGSAHLGATSEEVGATAQERYVLQYLVVLLGWDMEKVEKAISLAEVHWVPEPWKGPDGLIWSGMTDGHVITVVKPTPGHEFESPYRHELVHLVGAYLGEPDANHLHRDRWKAAGGSPSEQGATLPP